MLEGFREAVVDRNIDNNIDILAKSSSFFIRALTGDEVLQHTGTVLHDITDSIVIINLLSDTGSTLVAHSICGIEGSLSKKAMDILGFDPIGKEYEASPQFLESMRPGKLQSKSLVQIASPYVPEPVCAIIQKVFSIKEIYTIGMTADDELIGGIHLFSRSTISDFRIVEILVNQASIAYQSKKASSALLHSEQRYRSFMQNFKGIAYQIQFKTSAPLFLHGLVNEITGYDTDDFLTKKITWDKIVYPDDFSLVENMSKRIIQEPNFVADSEYRIICKDSQVRWVRDIGQSICDHNGIPYATQGAVYDITESKKSALMLIEEKEKLSVTVNSIADGIITVDTQERIMFVNKVAEEFTGLPIQSLFGKQLADTYQIYDTNDKQIKDLVKRTIETNEPGGILENVAIVSRDKGRRELTVRSAPIRTSDGVAIGIVIVFRDITDQKKIESQLQNIQRLESIGILAGGIAHDFNNLLACVFGYIDMAQLYNADPEKVRLYLSKAVVAFDKAKSLTSQLLTFAKGGTPVKRIISITKLIEESVLFALSGTAVTSILSFEEKLPYCEADRGQIGQVIDNILINARQAMPNGGIITITAERLKKEAKLPLDPKKEYVVVAIEDRAGGIGKECLAHIFDPFFTTKKDGSGLGLAIAFSIVKKHNGHIEAESEQGVGTTFRIYLPASEKQLISERKSKVSNPGKGIRVLIMDDEILVRELACSMLDEMGYQCDSVSEGNMAISLCRESVKLGNPYTIAILDLTVHGGLGGKETVKQVLEIDPFIKAIAVSGYSHDPVMADPKAYGFSAGLAKPYTKSEMNELIQFLVSGVEQ